MKKIILADDHALMRSGLCNLLTSHGHTVVAQACNFDELKSIIAVNNADVVICDCKMPGEGPADFLNHINTQNHKISTIFLSALESGFLYAQLLSQGAKGLVSKKSDIDDVLKALDSLDTQHIFLSDPIKNSITQGLTSLSNKEFQVFELIAAGLSNNEIAERLHRSASTINTHRVSLMQKLNIHSVVELVHFAQKNGMLDE